MKKALAYILALMLVLSLAACGDSNSGSSGDTAPAADAGSDSGNDAPATDEPAPSGDVVELAVWHYFAQQDGDRFAEFIDRYNDENPNVNATVTYVTREDLLKQFTMGAVSGELPDVGMVDNPDHASFSAMGVFEDITDLLDASEQDLFFEGPLKSAMYEGRLYGLPHNTNCLALFVNNEMLAAKDLTPPETWDDMLAVSEALKEEGSDVYPFAMCAKNDEEGTFQFMPWFISAGGDIADLSGANTVRSLEFLVSLTENGYLSQDAINWTQSDVNTQFINGKAAMMLNGPWQVPVLEQDAPDLDYSVVLVPKDQVNASVLGGENFAVCTGAPLQEAYDLVYWLCSGEVNADFCEVAGKFPPRSDAMAMKSIWTDDPVYSVFGQQLESAMPRGPHPRWPEVSTAISTALTSALTGVKEPQDALNDAAAVYADIMGE